MIEIVEGRGVGAGKSYYVCTRIIAHLAAGGTVFASSSFGLKWEETKKLVSVRYGKELEEGQYNSFSAEETWHLHEITPPGTPEMPVLIVLDEAHAQLNARDWADAKKRPFFNWLTQSRHDDNDLIFISQHAANIDKQIARLVTYIVRMRNMRNFAIPLLGKWPFKQFVAVKMDQDGRTVMEKKWMWHDVGIFRCYESKVMRGTHQRLAAVIPRRQLRPATTRRRFMKVIILAAIIVAVFCGFNLYARFSGKPEAPVVRAAAAAPVGQAPQAPALRTGGGPGLREVPSAGKRAAYAIEVEEFRGTDEANYLRTVGGMYEVGQYSPRGMVQAVRGYSAFIKAPDGQTIIVVAQAKGQPPPEQPQGNGELNVKVEGRVLSAAQRGLGGYPAEEDQERIARAKAGEPQN